MFQSQIQTWQPLINDPSPAYVFKCTTTDVFVCVTTSHSGYGVELFTFQPLELPGTDRNLLWSRNPEPPWPGDPLLGDFSVLFVRTNLSCRLEWFQVRRIQPGSRVLFSKFFWRRSKNIRCGKVRDVENFLRVRNRIDVRAQLSTGNSQAKKSFLEGKKTYKKFPESGIF